MTAKPRLLKNGTWRAERRHNGALRFLGNFRFKYEAQEAIRQDVEEHGSNKRGGQTRAGEKAKNKVSFRVTDTELALIQERATSQGVSVAQYLRSSVLGSR